MKAAAKAPTPGDDAADMAFLARTVCQSRAYSQVSAGAFLPGGLPAIAATTDCSLHLLCASEGSQEGEGQLEVVCEQPLAATARAVAGIPARVASGPQECLALLTDSGFLSILRYDAASARFVALQQLALPPEGDPFCLLAVHPEGTAVAVASLDGTVCLATMPAGAGHGGDQPRFGEPARLRLDSHLWSLALVDGAAGTVGSQAGLAVAALHQHPQTGSFAVAHYGLSPAQHGAGPGGRPSVVAFQPLPTSASHLGLPRTLVPLPLEHRQQEQQAAGLALGPGMCVIVRRLGLEVTHGIVVGDEAAAQQAAALWWRQQADGQPAASPPWPAQQRQQQRQALLDGEAPPGRSSGGEPESSGDEEMAAPDEEAPAGAGAEHSARRQPSGAEAGRRASFIEAWCWERQQGPAPVLVCALEGGRLWRTGLGDASTQGGAVLLVPPPTPQQGDWQLEQPARCLAALPRGLLVCCTDGNGLQLLRRRPCAQPAAQAGPSGGGGHASCYSTLLPAHLLAAQQAALDLDGSDGTSACCALLAAAVIGDCQLADLEACGQPQLYAACRSTADDDFGGSLCVLYPDPKPETAFELAGAAEAITGLWGLRRSAADRCHGLALLSYVGGSRLLATQGGIFRDVTDSYPLQPDAQTLAAGNVRLPASGPPAAAAWAAAQVTSHGVVLFDAARQPASGADEGQACAGYAWQPSVGSGIGAAAVEESAVLLFCTGGSNRHLVALLPAPAAAAEGGGSRSAEPGAGVSLVQAASLPVAAEVSCISNLLPQPGQLAVFAVGTYASTVLLVHLQPGAAQPGLPGASLQQLRVVDLAAASAGAGPPPPLPPPPGAASPLTPRSLQRQQLTPESVVLLPSGAGGGAASLVVGLRTGGLLQLRCSWGGGAAGQRQPEPEELLSVSLGHMPVVALQLPGQQPPASAAAAGAAPPVAALLSDRVSLLHHRPAPGLPAAAAGLCGSERVRCRALAVPRVRAAAALLLDGGGGLGGGGPGLDAMLEASQPEGQPLPLRELAAPAEPASWRAAAGAASPPPHPQQQQQQLFLLCACADGCLRMFNLDAAQLAEARRWALPCRLQPSCLAVHAASGTVAVAGHGTKFSAWRRWRARGGEPLAAGAGVQVIDPATGELLASYTGFVPGESINALSVWQPTAASQPAGGNGGPSAAAAAGAPARPGGEDDGAGGLRSHPIAFPADSPAAAAAAGEAAAAAGEELPWGGFLVVGTSVDGGGGEEGEFGRRWDDEGGAALQGRLLLLRLEPRTAELGDRPGHQLWARAPPGRGLQLVAAAELHLPSRVLALCPGPTQLTGAASAGGADAPAGSRLFASVGRRLVSFEWRPRQQLLRRVTWVPTRRPVSGGLLAAADRGEGATLYRYYEPPPDSPQGRLQQQRGRLARRPRLAPPGAAELRQLGLGQAGAEAAPGAAGVAGGRLLPEGEDQEPGFQVAATDAACRPGVGSLALPPSPGFSAGPAAAAAGALAAAALDTRGRLALLQQRFPLHEPALHERCVFGLGEPGVALLEGSLACSEGGCSSDRGSGAASAGGTAVAAGHRAQPEMVAVTAGGGAVSLLPLQAQQAGQLAALQAALARQPATAPVSGARHAAFRAAGSAGGGSARLAFRHPPPLGALAVPASPPAVGLPSAEEHAVNGDELERAAGQREEAQPGGGMAADQAPGSEPSTPTAAIGPPHSQQQEQQQRPVPWGQPPCPQQTEREESGSFEPESNSILDGDLLSLYLLMPPDEQRRLVAAAFGGGAADAARLAGQLTNLVAQLLL